MKALATSTNTYQSVLKTVGSGCKIPGHHGNKGRLRTTMQNIICTAFWRDYFATYCQTSDNELYFWPVGSQMTWVYRKKFPTFCKNNFPEERMPSQSCLISARYAKEFNNVKNRKDHFHIRCFYCSILSEERRIGFMTREQEEDNAKLQLAHDEEVKLWHSAETSLSFQATHSPGQTQVYKIDDTNAVGMPHCSLRLPKSVAKLYKVPFVPCLLHDVNANKKMYLTYSLKGQHKKGGNRFCTTMFYAFKAAKSDPTSPAACARDAIIIGDNYNENRNHTNMCFASEVIMAGWYDSITFLYGLLGHTHFGGDRDHRIHNLINATMYSNTLPEWIRRFPDSWPRTGTRPGAAFIDFQYDWDAYYKQEKVKLTGLNQRLTTFGGPFLICSFKVLKEPSGHVTVKYRTSCDYKAPFLGTDGTENSPGFILLRRRPDGIPPRIRPSPIDNHEKILRDIRKPQLHQAMSVQYNNNVDFLRRVLDWLTKCTTEGILPVANYPDGEHTIKPGNWGPRADISIHPERDPVMIEYLKPLSTRSSKEDFWRVPDRALRPEDRPARPPLPTYGAEPAKIAYDSVAHRASTMAALQPLDGELVAAIASDAANAADNEQSSDECDSPDHGNPYDSPDDNERPSGWKLPRSAIGTLVFCIDEGQVYKCIVDAIQKGGTYMLMFEGSKTTYPYVRSELYLTRAAAEEALAEEADGSSSSSSEGELQNRGYRATRKTKTILKKKKQASADRAHRATVRANKI